MSQDGIFFPPAPYVPPDPVLPGDGSGWPQRLGLLTKPLVDLIPVANPETHLGAAELNLAQWQVGAFGLCAPLAVLIIGGGVLRWGSLAWLQTPYLMADFSDVAEVAITFPATGQVQLAFDATQPGSDEQPYPLTIVGACAAPLGFNVNPGVLRSTVSITGSTVLVKTVNAAGAATDSPVIVVVH